MDALVKWWLIFWSCVVGAGVLQAFDMFTKLWHADATKLSFITIILFVGVTAYIGVLSYRLRKPENIPNIEKDLPPCWFSTEAMNALGMIGTVAGFIIMLSTPFHTTINPSNSQDIQQLISATAIGLSTAASATLVGLACSLITKWQLVVLEKAISEEDPQ